jgi:hypothetical protein
MKAAVCRRTCLRQGHRSPERVTSNRSKGARNGGAGFSPRSPRSATALPRRGSLNRPKQQSGPRKGRSRSFALLDAMAFGQWRVHRFRDALLSTAPERVLGADHAGTLRTRSNLRIALQKDESRRLTTAAARTVTRSGPITSITARVRGLRGGIASPPVSMTVDDGSLAPHPAGTAATSCWGLVHRIEIAPCQAASAPSACPSRRATQADLPQLAAQRPFPQGIPAAICLEVGLGQMPQRLSRT